MHKVYNKDFKIWAHSCYKCAERYIQDEVTGNPTLVSETEKQS